MAGAVQTAPVEPRFAKDQFPLANNIVARLADEGVPISAIARATHLEREHVVTALEAALRAGTIIELPPNDWPVKQKRTERSGHVRSRFEREHIVLDLMRTYELTRQQSVLFYTLIKHAQGTKEMLYFAAQTIHAVGHNTEPKIVDVVICKLRAKLPKTILIKTIWGGGYYIEKAHREKVWNSIGRTVTIDATSGDVLEHE